ncbi:hypothetical protein AC578_1113 [Pseudocercospora eumusae]|uniref:Uncharacterized protein n=1 Tax=Pseudocercospora eumusae TaxID=321146 RepID=A0A139HTQ4_9PEZI|nr:hypothetical protein AC578_1113 [Pseudocercospora eumusae]
MCYTQTPYHTVCGHYGKPTFTSGSPCIRAQTIKGYTNGCEYTEDYVQSTNSVCIACTRERANRLLPMSRNSSSSSLTSLASTSTTSTSSTISSASLRDRKLQTGSCGSWSYKGGKYLEASSLHSRTHADNAAKTDHRNAQDQGGGFHTQVLQRRLRPSVMLFANL